MYRTLCTLRVPTPSGSVRPIQELQGPTGQGGQGTFVIGTGPDGPGRRHGANGRLLRVGETTPTMVEDGHGRRRDGHTRPGPGHDPDDIGDGVTSTPGVSRRRVGVELSAVGVFPNIVSHVGDHGVCGRSVSCSVPGHSPCRCGWTGWVVKLEWSSKYRQSESHTHTRLSNGSRATNRYTNDNFRRKTRR